MSRDKLQRLRTIQSRDWYETMIMRPITIGILYFIADFKFLTPNLMTTLGNLFKLAGAGLIFFDDWQYTIWAVVFLQIGVLFDHLDGTLARYRRAWSNFGSFYDKVSDVLTWFPVVMALAWVAYQRTDNGLYLLVGAATAYASATLGYLKWLAHAESEKLDWHKAKSDPAIIAAKTKPPTIKPPPERTFGDWLRWFGRIGVQIFRFQEVDLFFWIGVALLLQYYVYITWFLFAIQVGGMLGMAIKRHVDIARIDRAMGEYRE